MNDMAASLEVRAGVMLSNLENSRGLVLAEAVSAALSPKLGRSSAHSLVESASRAALKNQSSLYDELRSRPEIMQVLTDEELVQLLDPAQYLGSTAAFIQRALAPTAEDK